MSLNFNIFTPNSNQFTVKMKDINRIKVMLVERKRTGKWLAEQLGSSQTTISRWCSNDTQPSLETFRKIAELLDVDIHDLISKSRK